MKKVHITTMVERWLAAGAISQEQATYMIADAEQLTTEESGNRFITGVMLLGTIAICLGLLLLISVNWEALSKTTKVILSLLLPIAPITFSYYRLHTKGDSDIIGRAVGIMGLVGIGGSQALIGQIYNLDANYTNFFWLWTILTVPLLFIFKRVENTLATCILLGTALFLSTLEIFGSLDLTENIGVILLTLGIFVFASSLYGIGRSLRHSTTWKDSARLLRIGAALLGLVTLYIMTFLDYARTVLDISYREPDGAAIPLSITLNLLFVGFIFLVMFLAFQRQEPRLGFNMVRAFGIYLLTKYITLFSEALGLSLGLLVGGTLFITGAWYLEKNKHKLAQLMQNRQP